MAQKEGSGSVWAPQKLELGFSQNGASIAGKKTRQAVAVLDPSRSLQQTYMAKQINIDFAGFMYEHKGFKSGSTQLTTG